MEKGGCDGEEDEDRRGRLSRHGTSWSRRGGRRGVGKGDALIHALP